MIIMAKGLPSSIKDGNLNKSKPNGLIESLTSNLSKLLKFNSDINASLIGKLTWLEIAREKDIEIVVDKI